MRNWTSWGLGLGLVVGALFASSSSQEAPSRATNAVVSLTATGSVAEAKAPADENAMMEDPAEEYEFADAAVTPISTEKPLPPNIRPTAAAAEVIKLAESGVEESVMMAFVTNSTGTFDLGAEDIIYLNDIGVPGPVLAAMIERDRALKGVLPNLPAVPIEPVPVNPTNQAALLPEDPGLYAPQPAPGAVAPEIAPEAVPPVVADAGYTAFYDSLAPYGTWIDVAGYGPCWQPTVVIVNPTWRPYCDGGRWIYSDCGWYWLSGYSWGWAPFHYGRWFQHHHWGWCWAPDRVWGPSWVCWRYTGSHCGWAPLPPGAAFRHGDGLWHHGYQARGSYGFGLGARSFTFVGVNHFGDRHLNRYALPPKQAAWVYSQTTPSATIVEDNNRIINHGIPVSHVTASTHKEIRKVAIRPVGTPSGRAGRSERFDGNTGTLSVFRPSLSPANRTPPAAGGRPRAEIRNERTSPALAPVTPRNAVDLSPRAPGRSTTLQPAAQQPSVSFTERPTTSAPAAATTRVGSEPTPTSPRREATSRPSSLYILHGSDRASRGAASGTLSAPSGSSSRSTPVVSGNSDPGRRQTVNQPPAPRIETPRPQPTTPSRNTLSRPSVSERSQPSTTRTFQAPTRSEAPRAASRAIEPPARSERPRQSSAPSFSAPAPAPRTTPAPIVSSPRSAPTPSYSAPRSAPAPSYSSPAPRSYSPPAASSAPRASVPESHSSRSASSAPSASSSAGLSRSSSGRNGR